MPYLLTWTDPELLFEHNGTKVYRAYKDDVYENPLSMYAAVYTEDSFNYPPAIFDIRELPGAKDHNLNNGWRSFDTAIHEHMKKIVRAAIDSGEIEKLVQQVRDEENLV